jgi:hypothetical protein
MAKKERNGTGMTSGMMTIHLLIAMKSKAISTASRTRHTLTVPSGTSPSMKKTRLNGMLLQVTALWEKMTSSK